MNAFGKTTGIILGKYHPLFAGLSFAAAARSDDETRYVLNHILVEQDAENELITRIVATDGKRLHVHTYDAGLFDNDICDSMLDPGLYEIVAISKKFVVLCEPDAKDLTFPNWRMVMPVDGSIRKWQQDAVNDQTTSKICMRTGALFATDYLVDACACSFGKNKEQPVTYGQETPTTALVIKHDLGKAMLMPMRFDNDVQDDKAATAVLPNMPEPEPSADQLL